MIRGANVGRHRVWSTHREFDRPLRASDRDVERNPAHSRREPRRVERSTRHASIGSAGDLRGHGGEDRAGNRSAPATRGGTRARTGYRRRDFPRTRVRIDRGEPRDGRVRGRDFGDLRETRAPIRQPAESGPVRQVGAAWPQEARTHARSGRVRRPRGLAPRRPAADEPRGDRRGRHRSGPSPARIRPAPAGSARGVRGLCDLDGAHPPTGRRAPEACRRFDRGPSRSRRDPPRQRAVPSPP